MNDKITPMLALWKKYVFISLCLIVMGVLVYTAYDVSQEYKRNEKIEKQISLLSAYIGIDDEDSFHRRVDQVRLFVQENSEHTINKEFRSLWRDPHLHYARFRQYVEGKKGTPAPMECSTRSGLMSRLLENYGYQTRMVDVYSIQKDFLPHTFLEVQNPATLEWEIADPDINIYWYDIENRERAGIKDLIANGMGPYVPCSAPDTCGWDIKHNPDTNTPVELKEEHYFSMARIHDPDEGKLAFYNSIRFDLEQSFPVKEEGGKTFCEVWGKVCRLGLQDLYRGES